MKKRTMTLAQARIKPGDYINKFNWFDDVWAEVEFVSESIVSYYYEGKPRTAIIKDIHKVHKKKDPWDKDEARIVHVPGSEAKKYADEFKYKGTYSINPWLWNYRGREATPKKPKRFEKWLKLHKIKAVNIPHDKVKSIIKLLQSKRIDGWYPICVESAEMKYNRSIYIKNINEG